MTADDIKARLRSPIRRYPVAYYAIFAEIAGGVVSGVFLAQCLHWQPRSTIGDGWFHKSHTEWTKGTGLTRREQDTARKHLKERGLLIETQMNSTNRSMCYRLDLDVLARLIDAVSTASS